MLRILHRLGVSVFYFSKSQLYRICLAIFGVVHAVLVTPSEKEGGSLGVGAEEVYQNVMGIRRYWTNLVPGMVEEADLIVSLEALR